MSSLFHVIAFSLLGGVVSLIGGIFLLAKNKQANRLITYATPFAAGALLSASFIDLLPEASHAGSADTALKAALVGILLFFLLERFLHWFHHHHPHKGESDPTVSLVVIGDTLHNIIDGVAIAAGFFVNVPTGITVTLAVAAHEIPQEIGDFGLLLSKGMSKKRVVMINFLSALATTISAVLFFTLGDGGAVNLDIILGLVAGFFIYIAVSDIIPSIHKKEEKRIAGPQTLVLLAGALLVSVTTSYLHEYIETDNHTHSEVDNEEEHLHEVVDHDHEEHEE